MKISVLALVWILGVTTSQAWNNPGHMAVAGLAFDELSPAQQQKVGALLRQHPDLKPLANGFPDSNVPQDDRSLFMAAATWPDLIKYEPSYQDVGYEEDQPAVSSISFDRKMHKGWHFIDTPLWVGQGAAPQPLPPAPVVNAVGVIGVIVRQFPNHDDTAKAYDLGWLLHLVGDLHQPLHASNAVSGTLPKGDTGGNGVTLEGETHGAKVLHSYWDELLGKTAPLDVHTHRPRLDKDVATASHIVASIQGLPFGANADNLDPTAWADESFKLAAQDVYNLVLEPVQGDHGPALKANVDDAYHQTALTDARNRVRTAGHRLALLIKGLL